MVQEDYSNFQLYEYDPTLAGGIIYSVVFGLLLIGFTTKLIISATKKVSTKNELPTNDYDDPNYELSSYDQAKYQRFETNYDDDESENFKKSSNGGKPKSVKKFIFGAFVPMIVGVALELVGYIMRCINHFNRNDLSPYIIQSVFLLVAPSLIAATIYMIFGRVLILLKAEKCTFIPVRFLTSFFVCGDVISFILQAAGGGMMSIEKLRDTGSNIAVGGLCAQLLFFGFFLISEFYFTIKIRKHPTNISMMMRTSKKTKGPLGVLTNWRGVNVALIFASFLIIIRCIVRLIEFIQGFTGFIMTHEVFIYVLDGLLMMLACISIFAVQPELVLAELNSYHN